ncbi:MAG: BACON domain-containing protein [Prevotella sp.]
MKLKYFFPMFIAAVVALFSSCQDEDVVSYLDNVRVTSSYVALPAEGGSTSIDVTASGNWTISDIPEWVTVSPTSGTGNATVTFTAPATTKSNEDYVTIECNGDKQQLKVMQIADKVELPISTCAEVNKGTDNVTYRIKGAVTKIENTTYGNMYINDGTGEVYIYGTLDAKGAEKNFSSLGIEVGDVVDCEGPRVTYSGTVELKNVTVKSITKSLIKVDSTYVAGVEGNTLPLEGGELTAYFTCKGSGISVEIPEEAKDWLSVVGINTQQGTVVFRAAANAGGDRSTTVTLKTTDGKKDYSANVEIVQKGAIIAATCGEFNAAPVGDTQYRVEGVVTSIANAKYGNLYIKDASGEVYVYGTTNFSDYADLKVGDIVTYVGPRGEYKGSPQMVNGTIEKVTPVKTVTIAEFRELPDDKNTYYRISGVVGKSDEDNTKYDLDTYGNFALTDETGSVYIYGVSTGWNGETKKFGTLGVKEGDTLTILAYKTSYKGLVEGVGMYLSHTSAE